MQVREAVAEEKEENDKEIKRDVQKATFRMRARWKCFYTENAIAKKRMKNRVGKRRKIPSQNVETLILQNKLKF